jgi:site-specific recombinase XerC
MSGVPALIASLLHGAGLGLLECAQLRVKDLDLERPDFAAPDGKGRRDRLAMPPARPGERLPTHMEKVRALHTADVDRGAGGRWRCRTRSTARPPKAPREWRWQWVFPVTRCVDSAVCRTRGHHLHSGYEIRAIQEALGDRDVSTTMIDTHVLKRGGLGGRRPPGGVLGQGREAAVEGGRVVAGVVGACRCGGGRGRLRRHGGLR